jgi:hypothetical protein
MIRLLVPLHLIFPFHRSLLLLMQFLQGQLQQITFNQQIMVLSVCQQGDHQHGFQAKYLHLSFIIVMRSRIRLTMFIHLLQLFILMITISQAYLFQQCQLQAQEFK